MCTSDRIFEHLTSLCNADCLEAPLDSTMCLCLLSLSDLPPWTAFDSNGERSGI